jgi:iron-sulfur cluster assembly accessory protein
MSYGKSKSIQLINRLCRSSIVALRHSGPDVTIRSSSLVSSRQQWRSMVVVTKTSPMDSPPTAETPEKSAEFEPSVVKSDDRLTISSSCVKQVHTLLKRRNKTPEEMFLRVFVDAGGCSGFTYKFELDDALMEEEDVVFELEGGHGARVVVDEASLNLIQGSRIDYVQEMIKSAFVVSDNPQSESACGCGSSFAVKNFSSNPALD